MLWMEEQAQAPVRPGPHGPGPADPKPVAQRPNPVNDPIPEHTPSMFHLPPMPPALREANVPHPVEPVL